MKDKGVLGTLLGISVCGDIKHTACFLWLGTAFSQDETYKALHSVQTEEWLEQCDHVHNHY